MISFTPRLQRETACALVFLLATPLAGAAAIKPASAPLPENILPAMSQNTSQQTPTQQSPAQQTTPSPQTGASQAPLPQPAIVTNPPAQTNAPQGASPAGQTQAAEPQHTVSPPVGTAAAPVVPANGVPASRPAGAAIAPAKQNRKHSFAIRVGLLVGAAVAIGAVTAATLSSPGRSH